MRMFRRLSVPKHAHPLVRTLFEEMNEQQIGVIDIAERSGVNKNTITGWRKRASPDLVNIEACFNVLGQSLVVRATRNL